MRDRNRSLMLSWLQELRPLGRSSRQLSTNKAAPSAAVSRIQTNCTRPVQQDAFLFQEGNHDRKTKTAETKQCNAASGVTYPFSADNLFLWDTAPLVESVGVKGFQSVFDSKFCPCSTAALKVLSGDGVGRAVGGRARPPSVLGGEMEGREGLRECVGPSVGAVVLRRAFRSIVLNHLHTSDGEAKNIGDKVV